LLALGFSLQSFLAHLSVLVEQHRETQFRRIIGQATEVDLADDPPWKPTCDGT
jgi:hypothetical protein